MALEKELETYRRVLSNFLNQQGEYILICGDQVAGTYPTWQEAIDAGYASFGLRAFLVKQIQPEETPIMSFVDPALLKRP